MSILISIAFAAFSFIWYARERTRGHLLFSLGWASAVVEWLVTIPITAMQHEAFAARARETEIATGMLDGLLIISSLYEVIHAIPQLLVGIGFLFIVLNESRGGTKGRLSCQDRV